VSAASEFMRVIKAFKTISRPALSSAGRVIDRTMLLATPFVHPPHSLVFTFHSVGPEDASHNDGSADHTYEVFASFLTWLKENTEVVPIAQVVPGKGNRQPASSDKTVVALSFDDAHLDNYTTVYPLLTRLQLPATFFVPSGLLGRTQGMTRSMVREVAERGIKIGAHSVTHRRLTTLSRREVEAELHDCKAALEDLTGMECRELAYPYGLYNETAMAIAESAGYACAFGASLRESPDARFALPRATIPNTNSPWSYRMALQDVYVWRRRLRSIRWLDQLIHDAPG
jgi:peptidoglycan/xylan/chitin deacetylase (PgdA/CDA1 family)